MQSYAREFMDACWHISLIVSPHVSLYLSARVGSTPSAYEVVGTPSGIDSRRTQEQQHRRTQPPQLSTKMGNTHIRYARVLRQICGFQFLRNS